jgi:hypothetical protein
MEHPAYELVIIGKDARKAYLDNAKSYTPNVITVYSETPQESAPFEQRFVKDKTLFYLCENGACQMPTEEMNQIISQLEKEYANQ